MTPPDVSLPVAVAAAVVATLAVARFTRLVVFDDWPPVVWARDAYRRAVRFGDWDALVTCPFCFAPWVALADLVWAWTSGLTGWWGGAWWAANLWFAVAYAAAMVVVRDEPAEP